MQVNQLLWESTDAHKGQPYYTTLLRASHVIIVGLPLVGVRRVCMEHSSYLNSIDPVGVRDVFLRMFPSYVSQHTCTSALPNPCALMICDSLGKISNILSLH